MELIFYTSYGRITTKISKKKKRKKRVNEIMPVRKKGKVIFKDKRLNLLRCLTGCNYRQLFIIMASSTDPHTRKNIFDLYYQ